MTYTCSGSVRGECGVHHRSIATCLDHILKDARWCISQGGYSDRAVTRTDGKKLTPEERDEVDALAGEKWEASR